MRIQFKIRQMIRECQNMISFLKSKKIGKEKKNWKYSNNKRNNWKLNSLKWSLLIFLKLIKITRVRQFKSKQLRSREALKDIKTKNKKILKNILSSKLSLIKIYTLLNLKSMKTAKKYFKTNLMKTLKKLSKDYY
jgi:hypothetical protein